MTRYRKIQLVYLTVDILSSVVVWLLFLLFRWMVYEGRIFSADNVLIPAFTLWKFMVLYPIGCLMIYYMSGYYLRPLSHRIGQEMLTTFMCALVISIGAFFIIIIDDPVENYTGYYVSLLVLLLLQFVLSWLPRLTVTLSVNHRFGKESRNMAIVGSSQEGEKVARMIDRKPVAVLMPSELDGFHELKENLNISEVIIALDKDADEQQMYQIINRLYPERVQISFPARVYDMLTGAAKIGNLEGEPLVTVTEPSMSDWQLCFKRAFDVVASLSSLVVLSPLMAAIAIAVRCSSNGKVIYRQERIGLYGEPFDILKFRTMVENAELETPMLSSADDPRVTKVGKWLRKYRLDELPQFWNILLGDMSIVGPRPERKYYIDKIVEKAPYYCLLYKIRPGLTSWGPVKVGYTDTLEKMIRRLNYDMVYVENMSLRLDLKIMLYTIGVIVDGKGQ